MTKKFPERNHFGASHLHHSFSQGYKATVSSDTKNKPNGLLSPWHWMLFGAYCWFQRQLGPLSGARPVPSGLPEGHVGTGGGAHLGGSRFSTFPFFWCHLSFIFQAQCWHCELPVLKQRSTAAAPHALSVSDAVAPPSISQVPRHTIVDRELELESCFLSFSR